MSAATGGMKGAMTRLGVVGDIVASQHRQSGMPSGGVRAWRLGFQAGIGIEVSEQYRKARVQASPATP